MSAPIPLEKKKKYVKARAKGLDRAASSIIAGINPSHTRAGRDLEATKTGQALMAKEIAEARKHAETTKEDVIDIIQDAIALARLTEDPACMIMGARELSKMLGYNAPEVKKVQHELGDKSLKALESLSDHELMKISRGRIIDAEVERLPAPSNGD